MAVLTPALEQQVAQAFLNAWSKSGQSLSPSLGQTGTFSPNDQAAWYIDAVTTIDQALLPAWFQLFVDANPQLSGIQPPVDLFAQWVQTRAQDLAELLVNSREAAIQAAFDAAAQYGWTPLQLQSFLKQIANLTPQQVGPLARLQKTAPAAVPKAASKAAKARAQRIATHELLTGYTQATQIWVDAHTQAGSLPPMQRIWSTAKDERVCPGICEPREGKDIDANGWSLPPAHMHCRCGVKYVPGHLTKSGHTDSDTLDWLATPRRDRRKKRKAVQALVPSQWDDNSFGNSAVGYLAKADGEHWVTLHGEHVLIGADGTVTQGPPHLKGTNLGARGPHHGYYAGQHVVTPISGRHWKVTGSEPGADKFLQLEPLDSRVKAGTYSRKASDVAPVHPAIETPVAPDAPEPKQPPATPTPRPSGPTDEQKAALRHYQEQGFDINRELRAGKRIASADTIDTMAQPITSDQTVYRGLFLDASSPLLKPGHLFTDPGLVSTSRDEGVVREHLDEYREMMDVAPGQKPIFATVEIPKGSRVVDVARHGSLDNQELILPTNTTFRVKSVSGNRVTFTVASQLAKTAQYDFASTQVNLPRDQAEAIRAYQSTISPDDLADGGLEDQPHVTVRYGLHPEVTPDHVAATIGHHAPVTLQFGHLASFPSGDKGAPLYVSVDSPALEQLHQVLGALPNTSTHGSYTPHVTVAYLKPEAVSRYLDDPSPLQGEVSTFPIVHYSDPDAQQTPITLSGVSKAGNPYHDALGRFSSASGSGQALHFTKQSGKVTNGYGAPRDDGKWDVHYVGSDGWHNNLVVDPKDSRLGLGHTPAAYNAASTADYGEHEAGFNPHVHEPPLPELKKGQHLGAGCVVLDGGHVYLIEPAGHWAGYEYTFPKGTVDAGEHTQDTALRETREESGLEARILDYLGDYGGGMSRNRMYVAVRTGGQPDGGNQRETWSVPKVSLHEAFAMANRKRDKAIVADTLKWLATHPQPIEKYNPYHDEYGRFATHDSEGNSLLKLKKTPRRRAWSGQPVTLQHTPPSKQNTGKIGEAVAAAFVRDHLGARDVRQANSEKNNFPVDLRYDHTLVEVKAGLASNDASAAQWRLTIGEPGAKEKAWLKTATPKQKAKWNARKQDLIEQRKAAIVANYEKLTGTRQKTRTITTIIDPDRQLADVYVFDGWHKRIGWTSEQAQKAYVGTYHYAS